MEENNSFELYDGMIALAFAPVLGLGMWKEYIVWKGERYEITKYIFPFCIAMKFNKID